jgi:ADP-ribose pyrophosphatase YjhB (NUDIX family)
MPAYRQKVEGVVINSNSEILLVKAPGSEFWMLPGGGIKVGETPKNAAKRELQEECGVEIHQFIFLEELNRRNEYSRLSPEYMKKFTKSGYAGADVFTFTAKVKRIDLSIIEDETVYVTEPFNNAIQIFYEQSKKQQEDLFRWIEVQRIKHIKQVFI